MSLILDGDLKKPIFSKHLSEWIRGKVCDIYENGIPLRDISYQLNVLTTVHNILFTTKVTAQRNGVSVLVQCGSVQFCIAVEI